MPRNVCPHEVPAPRLLHVYDDAEWVVGVFECVDGRMPGSPWVPGDLREVLATVTGLGLGAAHRSVARAAERGGSPVDLV